MDALRGKGFYGENGELLAEYTDIVYNARDHVTHLIPMASGQILYSALGGSALDSDNIDWGCTAYNWFKHNGKKYRVELTGRVYEETDEAFLG